MSFHVPEHYRVVRGTMGSDETYGNNGAFKITDLRLLVIIASDGMGWEHVSVHAEKGKGIYTPTWREMCKVKDMFWDPEDVVVQFHPAESEYINNHPNTLHLWRPTEQQIPTPPSILVGVKGVSKEQILAMRRGSMNHA